MLATLSAARPVRWLWVLPGLGLLLLLLLLFARPFLKERNSIGGAGSEGNPHEHTHDSHVKDAADAEHDLDLVQVRDAARRMIGIEVKTAKVQTFVRTLSVPGIVVERPGRSTMQVTAPMSGIVTKIYPTAGEAVLPGEPLFELRLIHEDVVQAQADLLRTAEELDVTAREIARLEKVVAQNAVPGKTILERQYEQQKQNALLRSQRQGLLLHGFDDSQIDEILKTRKLVQFLTVRAPELVDEAPSDGQAFHQIHRLPVVQGQYIPSGETLAILADHRQLFIEGNAFERDLKEIEKAFSAEEKLSAILEADGRQGEALPGLSLLYIASRLDPIERTVHFYVLLPNSIAHDSRSSDDRRYVSWKYRPGQRAQLQVPVESLPRRVILPPAAVVQHGAETYAFVVHDTHFDRRVIKIEHQDATAVAIAPGGGIEPGDRVVMAGAKQLWLALKNKSGGAVDPHAGHHHPH